MGDAAKDQEPIGDSHIMNVISEDHFARLDEICQVAVKSNFRHGAFDVPSGVATVPLIGGFCALVDAEDVALVSGHNWRTTQWPSGILDYATARKIESMHRLILQPASGMQVDHVNRIVLDNCRANLREATKRQNRWNTRRRKGPWNSSPYTGVTRHKDGWMAKITHIGETIKLGMFADEVEAAKAWDAKCKELRGEFAVLNFPEPGHG